MHANLLSLCLVAGLILYKSDRYYHFKWKLIMNMLRDDNGLGLEDNPPCPAVPRLSPIEWVWKAFIQVCDGFGEAFEYLDQIWDGFGFTTPYLTLPRLPT